MVAKSKYPQASFLKKGISKSILFFYLSMKMLPTVQFNDQDSLPAIKIHDVITDNPLPVKTGPSKLFTAKSSPKKAFSVCHIMAKFSDNFG